MSAGSFKPTSAWRRLFDLALPALDEVRDKQNLRGDVPQWTLGGGAAIAIRLDHRQTQDVDIFLHQGRL